MEKLGEYISYDDNFLGYVSRILSSYYILGMDTSCELLENHSNKDNLNKIMDMYNNLDCDTNPLEIVPNKIDLDTLIDIANDILISTFPDFKKNILNYDQLLYFDKELFVSDSSYNYHVTDSGLVLPKSIDLSDNLIEYSISVLNHEKTHALLLEKINGKNFPGIYFELLPVLIQKITNHLLISTFGFYNPVIIDDVVRTVDCQNHIAMLDELRRINIESETVSNKTVYNYFNLKANQYLLADWYSELLMGKYLDDSDNFNKRINQIFANQITINDFLNYYNITLQHNDLIPFISDRLEKVKKYSIKL